MVYCSQDRGFETMITLFSWDYRVPHVIHFLSFQSSVLLSVLIFLFYYLYDHTFKICYFRTRVFLFFLGLFYIIFLNFKTFLLEDLVICVRKHNFTKSPATNNPRESHVRIEGPGSSFPLSIYHEIGQTRFQEGGGLKPAPRARIQQEVFTIIRCQM